MATSPQPGARMSWWSVRAAREVFLLWAILTALLVAFSLTVPNALMGVRASTTMSAVEGTFTLFSVAASPVAALVWAIALYSLLRWRRKGSWTPTDADGPPIRGNRSAVGLWMGGSVLLCMFLLIWGLAETASLATPASSSDAIVVNVTGEQWVWTFSYPTEAKVVSDQLYLPLDRPVVFHVTSDDVVHSFWVVEMGIKVDANPGEITTTQTIPERLGIYHVRCAELCGLLHADMQTTVHVVTPEQFGRWIDANRVGAR